jgi:hypothetical protein
MSIIKQQSLRCFLLVLISLSGCVTANRHPCSEGSQPARERWGAPFKGIKKCYQAKDRLGKYVNNGKYYEWYQSDKIALVGEYKMGKKTGRWIEYDENGNKVTELFYEEGKEVPEP